MLPFLLTIPIFSLEARKSRANATSSISSFLYSSAVAEHCFAFSIFLQYFSNDSKGNATMEEGVVGGTYKICFLIK